MKNKRLEFLMEYRKFAAIINIVNCSDWGQCWSCKNWIGHRQGCAIFSDDPSRYLRKPLA